jgi:hypothetical protein
MLLLPGAWILLCQLISSQPDSSFVNVDPDHAVSTSLPAGPIRKDGRVPSFAEVAGWVQEQGEKFVERLLRDFIGTGGAEQLTSVRSAIVSEYVAHASRAIDSPLVQEIEIKWATEEAVSKFRREVEGLHKEIPMAVTQEMLESQIDQLRLELTEAILTLKRTQQGKLQNNFADAIVHRFSEIQRRARKEIDRFSCWSSDLEGMYLREFARETGYDQLPERMRGEVDPDFAREQQRLKESIHEIFAKKRTDTWVDGFIIVVLVVALLGAIKERQAGNGT